MSKTQQWEKCQPLFITMTFVMNGNFRQKEKIQSTGNAAPHNSRASLFIGKTQSAKGFLDRSSFELWNWFGMKTWNQSVLAAPVWSEDFPPVLLLDSIDTTIELKNAMVYKVLNYPTQILGMRMFIRTQFTCRSSRRIKQSYRNVCDAALANYGDIYFSTGFKRTVRAIYK